MKKHLKWSTNSSKRKNKFVDEGAYQVDIVVAFFAVLLILLMVSSPQIVRSVSQPGQMTYKSKDAETDTFFLRSFAALYPFRNIWVVRNGKAYEIDLRAISERYESNGSLDYAEDIKGAKVSIASHPSQIDAFKFKLTLFDQDVPVILTKRSFLISEKKQLISAFQKSENGSLIFVWKDQITLYESIFINLRKHGYPHKIVILKGDKDPIKITRNASFYELEKILRAY